MRNYISHVCSALLASLLLTAAVNAQLPPPSIPSLAGSYVLLDENGDAPITGSTIVIDVESTGPNTYSDTFYIDGQEVPGESAVYVISAWMGAFETGKGNHGSITWQPDGSWRCEMLDGPDRGKVSYMVPLSGPPAPR
ncbi:MAG: hypothetical protein AB8H80_12710 [Planctomycetota bacterium]